MSIVAKSGQGFSKESYLHKAAKQVLIGWLREAAISAGYNEYANIWNIRWVVGDEAPHYDVHEEYPLVKNRNLVPEHKQAVGWRIYKKAIVAGYAERGEELAEDIACLPNDGTAPTRQQLIAIGGAPTAVVDVAIVENNFIRFAFEVIHKSPTPDWKKSFLKEHGITLIEVRADWIMKQIQRPEHLKIIGQRGCCFSPALGWNRMHDQGRLLTSKDFEVFYETLGNIALHVDNKILLGRGDKERTYSIRFDGHDSAWTTFDGSAHVTGRLFECLKSATESIDCMECKMKVLLECVDKGIFKPNSAANCVSSQVVHLSLLN